MNSQYPKTLTAYPLVDEGSPLNNRDFCLLQLAKGKWCVCIYLRECALYAAPHYFKTLVAAKEYFNDRVAQYFEHYQELVCRKDSLIRLLSMNTSLTPQQRNKLIPLAIKVADSDLTTSKYKLCSLLLTRGFKSSDPHEIIEIIQDIEETLADNTISITV